MLPAELTFSISGSERYEPFPFLHRWLCDVVRIGGDGFWTNINTKSFGDLFSDCPAIYCHECLRTAGRSQCMGSGVRWAVASNGGSHPNARKCTTCFDFH